MQKISNLTCTRTESRPPSPCVRTSAAPWIFSSNTALSQWLGCTYSGMKLFLKKILIMLQQYLQQPQGLSSNGFPNSESSPDAGMIYLYTRVNTIFLHFSPFDKATKYVCRHLHTLSQTGRPLSVRYFSKRSAAAIDLSETFGASTTT